MEGHLLMSILELKPKTVLDAVVERRMTRVEAAALLDVSYRHLARVLQRYAAHGEAGLLHLSRGRSSNRGFRPEFWEQALALYTEGVFRVRADVGVRKTGVEGV